jgi:hypothetical protein
MCSVPAYITGDRISRITFSEFRKLVRYIGVKLKLFIAYCPQTDGTTERFSHTFIRIHRGYVNLYHTDWPKHIPALVYAYKNTVHTSTGLTPHRLLFWWCPRDIQAPLSSVGSGDLDVDTLLARCKADFAETSASLQQARQRMLKPAPGAPSAFACKLGDLVEASARTLELRAPDSQGAKSQPKILDPFEAIELIGSSVRFFLPDSFGWLVRNVLNVHDIRPWLAVDDFDVSLPYINDPSRNPDVAILDRKTTPRRIPKKLKSLLLIPAQYFVARKNGLCECVHQRTVTQPSDCSLILGFERKYPRSKQRVCEPMTSYPNSV